MTREYKKDSGIEWIGKIPKEWEVKKVKYVSNSISKGNGITKEEVFEDGDTPCVRYGEIYSRYNNSFNHCISATRKEIQKSPRYFNKGDILFASTGELVEEIGKNIVYLGEEPCLAGGDIIVLSHHQFPSFLNYALNCHSSQAQKSRNKAKLKVVHISASEIGDILIALPSLPIQQKIADYLDKVCVEVDEMVALQETMIEELKAYKQSVITEAVTKGLNPNVPMKDSGIDWIGEVPEHWGIQRLKTLGWAQNGISQSGEYFGEEYSYPFVNYSDAYKNYSIPYPEGRANSSEEDRKRYSLIEGDVLFTRTSETIEEIGFASTCMETIPNAVFSGFLIRFRPTSDKLFKGFSKYYFRSLIHRAYFVKQMNIVTRASLGQDLLKNLLVLLPPLSEQRAIASNLDTKCSEIDSLIALKQTKIEELKEYKKSVIYEYVTGKKEVGG